MSAGNFGGGELNIFFRGRNAHQEVDSLCALKGGGFQNMITPFLNSGKSKRGLSKRGLSPKGAN